MKNVLFKFNKRNFSKLNEICKNTIEEVKNMGSYKREKVIYSPQSYQVNLKDKKVYNFCANNYLGLSNNQDIIQSVSKAMNDRGYGMSSVRFICGTQDLHKQLEEKISKFHNKEDSILYVSCFDANTGLFETILGQEDAIISDALNHASIIDGIRLCKAKRLRYNHLDMKDLEEKLKEAEGSRIKLIATDGVFSMDGDIAPLDKIVNLAKKYDANIMIDESHACGVIGKKGKGTPEIFNCINEIDIITSTLGKALGGGCGGYITGKKEVIEVLRQKSRPYLFSNSILPGVAAGALEVYNVLEKNEHLFEKLKNNTLYFRKNIKEMGFKILGNEICPIVPIMIGNEKIATDFGNDMENEGIYVVGFCYPVVPKSLARIRVQISAGHNQECLDTALNAFKNLGKKYKLI